MGSGYIGFGDNTIATATVFFLKVRNILLIGIEMAFIFALNNADIANLLLRTGMMLAECQSFPTVNQLFNSLFITIQLPNKFSLGFVLVV
jgi:hypothetical protein